ncbi:hypothetical protein OsI_12124 [Oryza sativa Indica Group]|uniref:Uncharacterized protein n=2 Tax=Oryza TaxID=4527 RepID=A0A0E0GPC3_ORYNI|nr:hypothetical protein OsI_12124 [Oryza sativa Indica Group]
MPCSAAPSPDACPGPDTAVRRRMSSTASLSLSFLPVPLSSSSSSMVRGSVRRQRVGRSNIQSAIGSGEGRRSARRCRLEVGCWRRPQRGGVGRWAQEANASSLREDGVGTEFSKARSRSGGA